MQEEIHNHGFPGIASGDNDMCDDSKDIYAIIEVSGHETFNISYNKWLAYSIYDLFSLEEYVPSPSLAILKVINHMYSDGNGLNNIKVDEVENGNDLMLDDNVKELEKQNELHLKLSEIKGVMAIKDISLDKADYVFTSEFPMASGILYFNLIAS
ncbi:hypothetical protein BC332_30602 [Capsicum chinense]|nr:hypothetical protein BC332_30602 [Capsicum chinense]